MALYCDAQSVQLIKKNLVDRSSLSVREHNGLAKQVGSRPLELAKDSEGDFLTARQRFQLCFPRSVILPPVGISRIVRRDRI